MEGGRESRDGLVFLGPDGPQPGPTFVFSLNVNLAPESLNGPVPLDGELSHINSAAALLYFFHAIQTFPHEAKVPFVTREPSPMPWTFQLT